MRRLLRSVQLLSVLGIIGLLLTFSLDKLSLQHTDKKPQEINHVKERQEKHAISNKSESSSNVASLSDYGRLRNKTTLPTNSDVITSKSPKEKNSKYESDSATYSHGKQVTNKNTSPSKPVAWLRSKSKTHLSNVATVFHNLGYNVIRNVSEPERWHVLWSHSYPFDKMKLALKSHQKVNHFPRCGMIYVKSKRAILYKSS